MFLYNLIFVKFMERLNKADYLVAYGCAEYGLENHVYAGGLGFIAGDYAKSCADLGHRVVFFGLSYNKGAPHQRLTADGWQEDYYKRFLPPGSVSRVKTNVKIYLQGKNVNICAREFGIPGEKSTAPLILMDVDGDFLENNEFKSDFDYLYPSQDEMPRERLVQEQVLGRGGVRVLEELGYKNIKVYHSNEGHVAFAFLELMDRKYRGNGDKIKKVYTTHTPILAGHDRFNEGLASFVLGEEFTSKIKVLEGLNCFDYYPNGERKLNMTKLAMASSDEIFGVSSLHAKVSRYLFKDYPNIKKMYSVDNGVHLQTWASDEMQLLFDELTDREWRTNPKTLESALELQDQQVLKVHDIQTERLGEFLTGVVEAPSHKIFTNCKDPKYFDTKKLIIGFARRAAPYKQATLLFEEIDELRELGKYVNIVYALKAHPKDNPGKEVIKEFFRYMDALKGEVPIIFVSDYNDYVAKHLVRGVHLWLNTPQRLLEASGTSGMKCAVNGVPQMSTIDGWFVPHQEIEGYIHPKGLVEGKTGWGIGRVPTEKDFFDLLESGKRYEIRDKERKEDAKELVTKLKEVIIPAFNDKKVWAEIMKSTIAFNASWYNTHRMANHYKEVYGI